MDKKILLIDDDPDILEFLSYNIKQEGYTIKTAENGVQALNVLKTYKPDLIIIDVMMPEMDGIETCKKIRKQKEFDNSIITFLTARAEEYSQISGFESGADDYITKPIRPKILMSKIKSLLRRKNINFIEKNTKDFFIDKERYVIVRQGQDIFLPRKEFEIISLLGSKPEKVFSRDEIYEKVWGEDIIVGDRTIDVHIRKIRQKLGEKVIKTIKGVGYKFQIYSN